MLLNFVRYLFIRVQLFMRRTEGASAIEYALIVAMVALVLVNFGSEIGTKINDILTSVSSGLTSVTGGGTK
ncbi:MULTISPECIES: Flp family type IVb pilin [Pseudomonas]|uniref:Flp family type IVb pilin n=1 Tax=Pseudomonas TaxID=286 RepID=UPI000D00D3F4|nr:MULTISPECIES: Flp family type IVb pilin [Pseudomonas]PRA58216.1 Flp family type IVb pilin [Pseudomonas sp. MYb115]QXN50912.1 Flp family type IVb pilin [Pseudomonas fluorescens]WSO25230.1 Flp family type IVb pilin [Pseudomonas fluorescens]